MNDEMEIMREFEKLTNESLLREMFHNNDGAYEKLYNWFSDAMKWEVCGVLKKIRQDVYKHPCGPAEAYGIEIDKYIAKYSPKPQYCEGMQEAIKNGFFQATSGVYYLPRSLNSILRCPFCPEGKNCIGKGLK
jgi:hypothetical protein